VPTQQPQNQGLAASLTRDNRSYQCYAPNAAATPDQWCSFGTLSKQDQPVSTVHSWVESERLPRQTSAPHLELYGKHPIFTNLCGQECAFSASSRQSVFRCIYAPTQISSKLPLPKWTCNAHVPNETKALRPGVSTPAAFPVPSGGPTRFLATPSSQSEVQVGHRCQQ
jgi:hypothetical protein